MSELNNRSDPLTDSTRVKSGTLPCMYVSYFNPFYIVRSPQYFPIQAGKYLSNHELNITGDDTGNNISHKNFIYSELTVLYWVWKNAPKTEYAGFCHYRRFFDLNNSEIFPLSYRRYSQNEVSSIENLALIDYDKLFSDCDLIMPVNIVMPHSLRRNYEKYHYSEHYDALKQGIHEIFPEYLETFNYVLEETNRLPPYNMFITRWGLFESYCRFIFTLFSKLENEIKMPHNQNQQRIFGYMSERLLAVYIRYHKVRTKEYPLLLFNQDAKRKSKMVFYGGNIIKTLNFKLKYLIDKVPVIHVGTKKVL